MENKGTKLLSVGVVVKYYAPTKDQYTSRPIQGNRSLEKKIEGIILEYIECLELFKECSGQRGIFR